MNDAQHIVERWLVSGRTIRLCGLDLKPRPHPALPGTPQSIARGQGTVFFLDQPDHNNTWLLKIFAPSKRPDDVYLNAVADRLPGSLPFFSAKQRRLLQSHHLNWAFSDYRDPQLVGCMNGVILMPRVPGRPWASLADDLRDGQVVLDGTRRTDIAIHLADCVEQLESVHCAHRDLSAGNVFVTDDGQVYLIDCDCLFHPDITYPIHTSPGTNGYIAPFLHIGGADYDARGSWHPLADRFALAILIAEFLLVAAGTPMQEDGSLFNQQSLIKGAPSTQRAAQMLATIHPRLAGLFQQALAARCYDQCPAPTDWISAIRHHQRCAGKRQPASRVRCHCGTCGTSVWLAVTKLQELEQKNRAVLCPACLREQLEQASQDRATHNMAFPQAACEHCRKILRIPEVKLQHLRNDGKPVLCHDCLQTQLTVWQNERSQRDHDYPRVTCGDCGQNFRLNRQKRDHLLSIGKQLRCRDCFASKGPQSPLTSVHSWLSHTFSGRQRA